MSIRLREKSLEQQIAQDARSSFEGVPGSRGEPRRGMTDSLLDPLPAPRPELENRPYEERGDE